jgi:phage-related protein
MSEERRDLYWIASAKRDLMTFPEDVIDIVGQALLDAQYGDKHPKAKPMQSFGGAGVLEIVDDYDGDTYRAVYTVRLRTGVYVLHAFQKKSTRGVKTTQRDKELIKARLRQAEEEDARRVTVEQSA